MNTSATSPRSWPIAGTITALVALVVDQATKYIIMEWVMRPEGVTETPFYTDKIIELLPVFNFRMAWNPGISFSLFNSGEATTIGILIAVQVAITGVLVWFMFRAKDTWIQLATGLIIGGALGNIIDRVAFGAVADFLDFHVGGWHFPTFNVADSCISIGVFVWLLDAIGLTPHHKRAQPAKD